MVIVGIGFSAGGLQAATTMFNHVPHDSAIYVIIRHIPIDHRSELHQILQLHSKLTVVEATNNLVVKKDFVYIPPSNKVITLVGDKIVLADRVRKFTDHRIIDIFLNSLAESKGKRAVAIILSGTGSDGLEGSKNIKEAGGLVIAQTLQSCEFDSMPRSIIGGNLADHVLSPWDMPPVLLGHVSQIVKNDNLSENFKARV